MYFETRCQNEQIMITKREKALWQMLYVYDVLSFDWKRNMNLILWEQPNYQSISANLKFIAGNEIQCTFKVATAAMELFSSNIPETR